MTNKEAVKIIKSSMLMHNYRNKMIVTDYGICIRKYIDGRTYGDSVVITKEAFIEAYNKWIKSTEDTQNDIKKSEDKSNV